MSIGTIFSSILFSSLKIKYLMNSKKESVKMTKKTATKVKQVKVTIKKVCFDLFKKKGLDEVELDFILPLVKKVKKDTKFDKYHLSYWKSKYRTLETQKSVTKKKQVKKTQPKETTSK